MLYQNVLVHAMHWDHDTGEPGTERSDLEAAADLNRIHDLLTEHNHTEPSKRMSNAIKALRENAANRTPQQPRRPGGEVPGRASAREPRRVDDVRRQDTRRDGPAM